MVLFGERRTNPWADGGADELEFAESSERVRPEKLSGASIDAFLREHPNVVVELWASWCAPCRTLAPIVDSAARSFAGQVAFGKVNVSRDPTLVHHWNVRLVPTILFFRHGKLVGRFVGPCSLENLTGRIRRAFAR
jgi:thioredoxin